MSPSLCMRFGPAGAVSAPHEVAAANHDDTDTPLKHVSVHARVLQEWEEEEGGAIEAIKMARNHITDACMRRLWTAVSLAPVALSRSMTTRAGPHTDATRADAQDNKKETFHA